MRGKTHLLTGIAAALIVCRKPDPVSTLAGVAFAAAGAVIPDIDSKTSPIAKRSRRIAMTITASCTILALLLRRQLVHADAINGMMETCLNRAPIQEGAGAALFALLCLCGMQSAHRTFTHSLVGYALFASVIKIASPTYVNWFSVGYLSHLILDTLNRKQIKLFWPFRGGTCIGACKCGGVVDRSICKASKMLIASIATMQIISWLRAFF